MSAADDERLVDAVLAGDPGSAVVLRNEYLALAQSLAIRLVGDESAAERALDAFLTRLAGWPRQNKLSTYATSVMRQAIDPERYGPAEAGPQSNS